MNWGICLVLVVLLTIAIADQAQNQLHPRVNPNPTQEGFSLFGINKVNSWDSVPSECPTRLTRVNGQLTLTHKGEQVKFGSLKEYTHFVEALRARGIRCPVLYLEPLHDAQGGISVKSPDDPITQTTGLGSIPADQVIKSDNLSRRMTQTNDPVAQTQMPVSFDSANQSQGTDLPVDRFFSVGGSVNPYSPEWKGQKATQQAIDAGEMDGDQVYRIPHSS